MFKKLHGKKKFTSKHILYFSFLAIPICIGCQFDPYADLYLRDTPPLEEIHGKWGIDFEQTSWREAIPLLRKKSIHPNRCCLWIKEDGTFVVEEIPDPRGFGHIDASTPYLSGTGKWHARQGDEKWVASLSLSFSGSNGNNQHNKGIELYYRYNNGEYFLHDSIGDPDSAKALVFRKLKGVKLKGTDSFQE